MMDHRSLMTFPARWIAQNGPRRDGRQDALYNPAMMRLLLALILVLVPLSSRAQPAPGGPPAVGVVRAERQQITETDEFIGRIQSIGRVALVARVSAFLEKRLFVEGAEVKQGDLLYQLEQPPFQAQVENNKANVAQLEAQHRNAQLTLERAQYLLKTVAGQQSTVDSALASERSLAAQIEGAKAQLQIAEINLGYTEIRAPIDGKISATDVTEGNVVSPTSGTLANLVSQDPMYVLYPVSVRAGLDLRNRYEAKGGFKAVVLKIRLPDGRIYGQTGKLDYVSPTVATNTDTIMVRGVVPNPRAAVLSDQQGDYVYVVDAQNKAQQRRIQLGQSTPSTAVVTNGLKEGELVISEGLQRVRPGQTVSPSPATPPPAISPALAGDCASGAPSTEPKATQ